MFYSSTYSICGAWKFIDFFLGFSWGGFVTCALCTQNIIIIIVIHVCATFQWIWSARDSKSCDVTLKSFVCYSVPRFFSFIFHWPPLFHPLLLHTAHAHSYICTPHAWASECLCMQNASLHIHCVDDIFYLYYMFWLPQLFYPLLFHGNCVRMFIVDKIFNW